MTATLVTQARPIEARLRPLYATGFIHGFALLYTGALGVMCVTLSLIVARRR